uniref:Uncharacterized protein n=1 Tax=Plectus sambesii TaxID=2011161 RepID=A0A914WFS9_9BILA
MRGALRVSTDAHKWTNREGRQVTNSTNRPLVGCDRPKSDNTTRAFLEPRRPGLQPPSQIGSAPVFSLSADTDTAKLSQKTPLDKGNVKVIHSPYYVERVGTAHDDTIKIIVAQPVTRGTSPPSVFMHTLCHEEVGGLI